MVGGLVTHSGSDECINKILISHDNNDKFFDDFVLMNYIYNFLLNSFKIPLHV